MKKTIVSICLAICAILTFASCENGRSGNDKSAIKVPASTRVDRNETKKAMPNDILPSTNVPDTTYEGAVERAAEGVRRGVEDASDRLSEYMDDDNDRFESHVDNAENKRANKTERSDDAGR